MDNAREFLAEELRASTEARLQYASDLLNARLALQIKTLRMQHDLTQEQLANLAGLYQSQISAMEQISCNSWKVSTLQKLAKAFDLALSVRFLSYGKFLEEALSLSRESLEQPSFDQDPLMTGTIARTTSCRILIDPGRFTQGRSDLYGQGATAVRQHEPDRALSNG